jgi:hypothetical protein
MYEPEAGDKDNESLPAARELYSKIVPMVANITKKLRKPTKLKLRLFLGKSYSTIFFSRSDKFLGFLAANDYAKIRFYRVMLA